MAERDGSRISSPKRGQPREGGGDGQSVHCLLSRKCLVHELQTALVYPQFWQAYANLRAWVRARLRAWDGTGAGGMGGKGGSVSARSRAREHVCVCLCARARASVLTCARGWVGGWWVAVVVGVGVCAGVGGVVRVCREGG